MKTKGADGGKAAESGVYIRDMGDRGLGAIVRRATLMQLHALLISEQTMY